jgi:hypothetical protein
MMQQVVSHTAVGVSRSGWCLTNRKLTINPENDELKNLQAVTCRLEVFLFYPSRKIMLLTNRAVFFCFYYESDHHSADQHEKPDLYFLFHTTV